MSPWNFHATAFQESHKNYRKIFMIFFGLTDWDGNQHLCFGCYHSNIDLFNTAKYHTLHHIIRQTFQPASNSNKVIRIVLVYLKLQISDSIFISLAKLHVWPVIVKLLTII